MPSKARNAIEINLEKWEKSYKKSFLTFWILLLLSERPGYGYELVPALKELTQGMVAVDGNSMYRALARIEKNGLVKSELCPSASGPPRRYYSLTETGLALLRWIIARNLTLLETPAVAEKIRNCREK